MQFKFLFCNNVLTVLALSLHFSFDAHRKSSGWRTKSPRGSGGCDGRGWRLFSVARPLCSGSTLSLDSASSACWWFVPGRAGPSSQFECRMLSMKACPSAFMPITPPHIGHRSPSLMLMQVWSYYSGNLSNNWCLPWNNEATSRYSLSVSTHYYLVRRIILVMLIFSSWTFTLMGFWFAFYVDYFCCLEIYGTVEGCQYP